MVQEKISNNEFIKYFSLPQQWEKIISVYLCMEFMLNSRTIYFAVPELHYLNFIIVSFQIATQIFQLRESFIFQKLLQEKHATFISAKEFTFLKCLYLTDF